MAAASNLKQEQQDFSFSNNGSSSTRLLGKRPADQALDEGRTTKRAADGMQMDAMGNPIVALGGQPDDLAAQMGGGGVVFEQMDVPDESVGMIIGRGGENISNIQTMTGCRVQMSPDVSEAGMRNCTFQGSREAVERARTMVVEVVERASARPPPNSRRFDGAPFGGDHLDAAGGEGVVTEELLVPGLKCGLIIGKGGETIKQIQERAGVKIVLIQESHEASSQSKPLRISGDAERVAFAKSLCEEIINSKDDMPPGRRAPQTFHRYDAPSAAGGQPSVGEVIVPRCAVGTIIGKGGEMIKQLCTDSGARIQFNKDESQEAAERTAVLQGTTEQIQRATQMISDLVQRSMQMGGGGARGGMGMGAGQEEVQMRVPASRAGLVIGKGGETINGICHESGANIQLSRDAPVDPNEKLFTIRGSAAQVRHAQEIIRSKIGDEVSGYGGGAPSMGSFGRYGGGGGGGGGYTSPQTAGGWQGADAAGLGDAASWAQYFAAQQQQQYVAAAAAAGGFYGGGAPQQAAAQPQPAINPATGQADYSAQWAEYYRSMGMPEQAAAIEQQAKQARAAAPANYGYGGGAPQHQLPYAHYQ